MTEALTPRLPVPRGAPALPVARAEGVAALEPVLGKLPVTLAVRLVVTLGQGEAEAVAVEVGQVEGEGEGEGELDPEGVALAVLAPLMEGVAAAVGLLAGLLEELKEPVARADALGEPEAVKEGVKVPERVPVLLRLALAV